MVKFLIESVMVILFLSIINSILGEQGLFNILYGISFLWIVNILSPVDYD